MLLHKRNRASRHEVTTIWSLEDLARASLALDVQDEAERRAEAKRRRDAEVQRQARAMNKS